jgi:hypothetical protein
MKPAVVELGAGGEQRVDPLDGLFGVRSSAHSQAVSQP